ncbi:MAG: hypothetical protein AAF363_18380 [Bacteroidota bacterium]
MSNPKMVFEFPVDRFERLEKAIIDLGEKKGSAKNEVDPDYLTPDEFAAAIKASRWKFEQLKSEGKVKTIRRGRKIFIPKSEVKRFYDGEME